MACKFLNVDRPLGCFICLPSHLISFIIYFLLLVSMFSLRTSKAINITTFEVDVRLDLAGDDLDLEGKHELVVEILVGPSFLGNETDLWHAFLSTLSIFEVYTLTGDYYGMNGDASAWTQIANTRAAPLPDGKSALIPVQHFDTVVMAADELRSFYITMKGPYIDSLSSAMTERGQLDREFDAFRLDIGGGLGEYKFPAAFDEVVNPKFAGAIHYQENTECAPPIQTVTTSVEFDFLLDVFEYDETIFGQVAAAVKELVDGEFSNLDGVLKDSGEQHNLRLAEDPSGLSSTKPLRKSQNAMCIA